jgi:hypothetical protein
MRVEGARSVARSRSGTVNEIYTGRTQARGVVMIGGLAGTTIFSEDHRKLVPSIGTSSG